MRKSELTRDITRLLWEKFLSKGIVTKLFSVRPIINCIVFIAMGVYIFFFIQKILMPEWNWPQFSENISWDIESFKELDENSLDVVFCGTSHMQYGISPMEIYRDYGIVSYNLATSGQPLDMSYFMMEEMFKAQSPKYVVLDASNLYFQQNIIRDVERRYCLDSLTLSKEKIKAAEEYSKMTEDLSDKDIMERFNSVIFPIIFYHTNWKTVIEGNFEFEPKSNYCTAGYVISPYKNASYTDMNGVDIMVDEMKNDNVQHTVIRNADGEVEVFENESSLYSSIIPSEQKKNLDRINELCKANNAKLIIVKIPVVAYPYNYGSAWSKEKYIQVKTLASEMGVDFWDMNYDTDVELDLANDYIDSGVHLNYLGAVKASKCMGEYLAKTYNIKAKNSSFMEANMADYEKISDIAKIELETDFLNYCKLLNENTSDYIVCIASKEYWKTSLLENDYNALNVLGLYGDIKDYLDYGNSYVAVIDGGVVEHEEISNRNISFEYNYTNKDFIRLISAGAKGGNSAEIYLNDTQVAMNGNGLNIVVLDKATNKVVDSCYIDTNIEGGHDLVHNGNGINYMFDIVYNEN